MSAAAKFAKTEHGTQWIPVKNLSVVWRQSQRECDERWAKEIAESFDPEYFGTITVTKANGSGMYHIVDGQHRVTAVKELYGDAECVPCNVFDVDDPKRAAEIFDRMNTRRKPPASVAAFKVRVTAGHEIECAVNSSIRFCGYKVDNNLSDGTIRAVGTCVTVHKTQGAQVLRSALLALAETWGRNSDAVDGGLIRGFAAFFAEHGAVIDRKRLTERISKKFTPGRLLSAAKAGREMFQENLAGSVAEILKRTYNDGLRAGRIGN